jgi:hypothetical protein
MMTFLRRLARIAIRPRTTMREIVDTPSDRMVLPLVVLAIVSGLLRDFHTRSFPGIETKTWLIICGAILGCIIVFVLLFYAFAWLAYVVARILEGTGDPSATRSALAWGTAPIIWALLYRLPVALLAPSANPARVGVHGRNISFTAGMLGDGCFSALLYAVVELALLIWYLVVASQTLAEAQRFSVWRGLGTLAIVAATPVVVMTAAFLSLR